ncbi:pyridoxal phosphate-dependent decarboxylase family protein [Actinomadura rupiterrae]|uniref:pyridoxal phosphate-dependent decarboxylase family protein n=1 Tax=Actinomadura rupiterrae TaxID=559627 RepID=UPI0020A4C329|nr:pyridoxal-dependent decarboxylase [Actinomadura rupiterrae]MCP2338452.1 L-2,4-diaminobutyrate decarboxylase [Actinomadura rupiterrae]
MAGAFDPDLFGHTAEQVALRLRRHLADPSVRGLDLVEPDALAKTARELMTTERDRVAGFDEGRLHRILDLYIGTGIQVHSPGYMGRQFSGVVPLAAVVDLVSSVVNQPSSFYEAAQLPSVAERVMADELNRYVGFDPDRFAMVTTSGGSLANLTALLAARNHAFPGIWTRGAAQEAGRPAIAVGAEAHYSVVRAAGVLGIGEDQVVRLPADRRGRIRADRAGAVLDDARRRGLNVFCLVASAGTTSMGAFDPLAELAAVTRPRGIWLHVDGAHGASLLLSARHRHRLRGLDQADSLTWDAHKMLFVPSPCTLLFYRDAATAAGAFRQRASYVFDDEPDVYSALDSGDRTLECTKRPMIMPLWTLWAMYGPALFARKIDHLCATARLAHRMLRAEPGFAVLHQPEANILCFRYSPPGLDPAHLHRLQLAIRDRVRADGRLFISKVDIDGVAALRLVVMNHRTDASHLALLIAETRAAGRRALREAGLPTPGAPPETPDAAPTP